MIGRTLSHFKITAKLGEGGMGEVYRATDTKLGREVAIKVLPEEFVQDSERLARFEREAKMLASLNHPNIGGIHGLEESEGVKGLVLELIEGPTLADRIAQGAIQLDEALSIAKQIAQALEAAHEQGIIHRDLKPANVKVKTDGTVKVLDFGLAKAWEPAAGDVDLTQSPTLTAQMTQAGVILGTAAYMSPEQARGRAVDKRADIWAFGAVLYEMLTGSRPFGGGDLTDTIAAVVRAEPDWGALPAETPVYVRTLLRRSLQKDSRNRLHDIADARIEIEDPMPIGDRGGISGDFVGQRRHALGRRLPWILVGVLFGALLLGATSRLWRIDNAPEAFSLRVALSSAGQVQELLGPGIALSPDGSKLALIVGDPADTRLYLRSLRNLNGVVLPGTEGANNPFFSPDSQNIGFFAQGELKRISVSSRRVQTLAAAVSGKGSKWSSDGAIHRSAGGSWGSDGTIVFANPEHGPLLRVPATGGEPTTVSQSEEIDNEGLLRWPQILPGGQRVLLTASRTSRDFAQGTVEIQSLETGSRKVLMEKAYFGRYVSTGHLIFVRDATLFAVAVDLDQQEILGQPVPIIDELASDPADGSAQLAFSETGSLVYGAGTKAEAKVVSAVWVDRQGKSRPLIQQPGLYYAPRFSPDGGRLAFHLHGDEHFSRTAAADIWVSDLRRDTMARVTFDEAPDYMPIWAPDGSRLIFSSERESGVPNLFWKSADGVGEAVRLTASEQGQWPCSMSPDGRNLIFIQYSLRGDYDIWRLPMNENGAAGEPEPLIASPFSEWRAELSPDGRWLAYSTDESGRMELYVSDFPNLERKWQVSSQGENYRNIFGRWSRSAPELFYRSAANQFMVVPFDGTGNVFQPAKPALMLAGNFANRAWPDWDVAPGGEEFVVFEPMNDDDETSLTARESAGTSFVFVFNWFNELRELVP